MKIVNKYNMPVLFLMVGIIVSLLIALIFGLLEGNAYYGTISLGAVFTISILWGIGLWLQSKFSKNSGSFTNTNISEDLNSDDGWE